MGDDVLRRDGERHVSVEGAGGDLHLQARVGLDDAAGDADGGRSDGCRRTQHQPIVRRRRWWRVLAAALTADSARQQDHHHDGQETACHPSGSP